MPISKIIISNFKSFKSINIDLDNLNILIGSNASGKSNFVQIFKFLRDIVEHDLRNAISIQGGIEYLRNIKLNKSNNISIEIHSNNTYMHGYKKKEALLSLRIYETIYKFEIEFTKDKIGYKIANDDLIYKYNLFDLEKRDNEYKETKKRGEGKLIFSNSEGVVDFKVIKSSKNLPLAKKDIIPDVLVKSINESINPTNIMLETPFSVFPFRLLNDIFNSISIYDIDPKLAKRSIAITGRADLEEDGNNLAIVLQNILEDKEEERRLYNLIKRILPFVYEVGVESFVDTSLILKLKEVYAKRKDLPASLVSDGTINITALIVALYFEGKDLDIFEEPERNIHPSLISKVLDMMKEISEKKQIIATTHNPEFVKGADLKNLLFISRDQKGYSIISKLDEKNEIKSFLENEIGIEELYVDNLLGI